MNSINLAYSQWSVKFTWNLFVLQKAFQILRFLKIEVVSEVAKDLPPTIPYERPKRKTMRELWGEVVEGERPPR